MGAEGSGWRGSGLEVLCIIVFPGHCTGEKGQSLPWSAGPTKYNSTRGAQRALKNLPLGYSTSSSTQILHINIEPLTASGSGWQTHSVY